MAKEMTIDLFVCFHYPTRGRKVHREYGNAYVGVLVDAENGMFEVPTGITRGMLEILRKYLAGKLEVDPELIYIENVVRLEPEEMPEDGDE